MSGKRKQRVLDIKGLHYPAANGGFTFVLCQC